MITIKELWFSVHLNNKVDIQIVKAKFNNFTYIKRIDGKVIMFIYLHIDFICFFAGKYLLKYRQQNINNFNEIKAELYLY